MQCWVETKDFKTLQNILHATIALVNLIQEKLTKWLETLTLCKIFHTTFGERFLSYHGFECKIIPSLFLMGLPAEVFKVTNFEKYILRADNHFGDLFCQTVLSTFTLFQLLL